MMAYFYLGICQSSKSSMTGHVSLQEPTALCTGVTGTLNIVPHAPLCLLMLHRLPGWLCCNVGTCHHQELCYHREHPGPLPCGLQLMCHLGQPLLIQQRGLWLPPWTTMVMRRWMDPSISFTPVGFSLQAPGRKEKHPRVRWCIALPLRMVKLIPCGEPPSG